MNEFAYLPGFEEELRSVRRRAVEIAEDALMRQPLSAVLEEVFAADGKLMRPALLLLFGKIGVRSAEAGEQLINAGAVLELTHMASLIHDDIVDDAPTRRGRTTVQAAYGKDMAVYAGDYLLSKVLYELVKPGMEAAGQILSRSIADMCSGELGQYEARFQTNVDENRYFMNISGKTAALFSAACEIGAVLSGCDTNTVNIARRFGHSIGVIFQLRDDLMDCIPEHAQEGKLQGMDFISGIYTLPAIYSFRDREYGDLLKKLAAEAEKLPREELSARLYEYVSLAGGIEYTKWIMRQYADRAENALNLLPASGSTETLSGILKQISDI